MVRYHHSLLLYVAACQYSTFFLYLPPHLPLFRLSSGLSLFLYTESDKYGYTSTRRAREGHARYETRKKEGSGRKDPARGPRVSIYLSPVGEFGRARNPTSPSRLTLFSSLNAYTTKYGAVCVFVCKFK